jgi:hypothetical protein
MFCLPGSGLSQKKGPLFLYSIFHLKELYVASGPVSLRGRRWTNQAFEQAGFNAGRLI